MKTRKTKKRNIIRRTVAFLLCMTMVLGLGMQDVIEQVYAEGVSAVSQGQSADVPATQEVESTETTTPEGETDPTASEETGPATPEEEPTASEEDKKPAEPTNPTNPEENTEATTPPTETTGQEGPTTPAEDTENAKTDDSTGQVPATPETPADSNGSGSSDETVPVEDTETEGAELPVEEKPVSELAYAAEDGSFSVKAAAVSEDVDLSGIEIHASQVQKDGEEYAAAEELVAGALDAESRQIEELQAYDIWFTYTENGETADLSGQVQISLEYTAPKFPEGTDAQLEVFCLNGGAAEAVDGTDALAAGCELYALAWAVPAESTDTWEWTDGQVIIKASAEKGVLPEGAEISVTPIVKTEEEELANLSEEERAEAEAINEQYAQTEEKLTEDLEVQAVEEAAALPAAEEVTADAEAADAASDSEGTADTSGTKTLEGFLAYDICFLVNGEEVEPADGGVNVSIEFSEAVIPAGVSENAEVSVVHLKEEKNENGEDEVVVEDLTTEETTTVETTDKAEVKKIELVTESFSSFIIRWEGWTDHKITVFYVDEDGKPITGSQKSRVDVDVNDWVALGQYGTTISGYSYEGAHINSFDGTRVHSVRYRSSWGENGWQYRTSANGTPQTWNSNTGEYEVYLVYSKAEELTTVETVDNADAGITMIMKDYDYAANGLDDEIGGEYAQGNVKQGLLKRTLSNGYPVTERGRETSLRKAFANGKTVNHLFLQSTYDETGYYEYSSFENYAYLENTGDFTVYEQIGTPEDSDAYYFKRGNFMPYNRIEAGKYSSNRNLYDENGNPLSSSDPRYNERLYKTQGNNNFYFSMYMEANFSQPKDGQVEHNGTTNPMIYEFNGDDDLWIYIDDVLVLDIGGIHDAHSGYINFATGDVHVECINTSGNDQNTTIKEMYQLAGVFPDGSEWDDDLVDNYFTGDTFKNYTTHTMKMFYMERGAGASNLHMRFNLQTVPSGTVEVKKELTNTDKDRYANVQFAFQMFALDVVGVDEQGNEIYSEDYVTLTGATYGDSGDPIQFVDYVEVGGELYNDVFYLKPGETARFSDLQSDRKYYVKEIGVRSEEYDTVIINGVEITIKDDGGTSSLKDVTSDPTEVGSSGQVTFQNSCSVANRRELQITKKMAEGQTTNDTFSFQVLLEGTESEELIPYEGKYYLTKTENGKKTYYHYENGELVAFPENEEGPCGTVDDGKIEQIPVGYTVAITQILSDTKFKVVENDPNEGLGTECYKDPIYDVQDGTADDISENGAAEGTIKLGTDAVVTITNTLLPTPDQEMIRVQKTFKGLTRAQIETLAGFQINVDDSILALVESGDAVAPVSGPVTGSNGEIIYNWMIPAGESSYSVSESGQVLTPYVVTTIVNEQTYTGGVVEVSGNPFSVNSIEVAQVANVNASSDISLNSINLMVIKQTDGTYVVWSKEVLSVGERTALQTGLVGQGIISEGADVKYFSTESLLTEEFYYTDGKISVADGKLSFELEKDVKPENVNIWTGTYEMTGHDAEIEVVNTYTLPEVQIDLKKYGTDYTEDNLRDGAVFSLYKGVATDNQGGVSIEWPEEAMENYKSIHVSGTGDPELTIGEGYYKLVEDTAPSGYQKLEEPIYFKVTITVDGANIVWIDEAGNELEEQTDMWQLDESGDVLTIQIKNDTLYDLPEAGGPGIHLYMLGGVALMMAGTLLVYKKRKEEVLRS